jgi:hypothetical protein
MVVRLPMKYERGMPNKWQQRYVKMIQKLDRDINPSSIELRIVNSAELDLHYEVALRDAKNNFERMRLERDFQSKRLLFEKLAQVVFKHPEFRFPFYFELVPLAVTNGTLLESTITTIINSDVPPIFFGRTHQRTENYLLITSQFDFEQYALGEHMDINDFQLRGQFELGSLLASIRRDIGEKVLLAEGAKTKFLFAGKLQELNEDAVVQEYLRKLGYLSRRVFRPADAPSSKISFGSMDAECAGCIFPVTETQRVIQVGTFTQIHKSYVFRLLKHLLSIL